MKESKRSIAPELTRRSLGLLLLAAILTLSQRVEVYLPFCLNWPVAGESQITQKFSYRHQGLDIGARRGTPVIATTEAKVVSVVSEKELPGDLGNYTQISASINGKKYTMTYAHLQEASDLQLGQELLRGQFIGRVGSTGYSTGPPPPPRNRAGNSHRRKSSPESITILL